MDPESYDFEYRQYMLHHQIATSQTSSDEQQALSYRGILAQDENQNPMPLGKYLDSIRNDKNFDYKRFQVQAFDDGSSSPGDKRSSQNGAK